MGYAVGVRDAADGQISDGDDFSVRFADSLDAARSRVDADAVHLDELILRVGRGRVVPGVFPHIVGRFVVHQLVGGARTVRVLHGLAVRTNIGPRVVDLIAAILQLLPPRLADGHQLVADDGLGLARRRVLLLAHAQEAVDHVAPAVRQVVIRLELEVAHPGEGQGLQALGGEILIIRGVGDVGRVLAPHQEETVAHQRAVHGVAGVVAGGGHV